MVIRVYMGVWLFHFLTPTIFGWLLFCVIVSHIVYTIAAGHYSFTCTL